MVPTNAITAIQELENDKFESLIIKRELIAFLGEINYFPAVQFLEGIGKNEKDELFVKMEASRTAAMLRSVLGQDCLNIHLMDQGNRPIKKKQYGGPSGQGHVKSGMLNAKLDRKDLMMTHRTEEY
jgi:hypothetical protein